jgi:hypothetical protein
MTCGSPTLLQTTSEKWFCPIDSRKKLPRVRLRPSNSVRLNERSKMPKVRGGAAKRWANRTAAAAPDYVDGIKNPTKQWETATLEAEANHKAGTEAALREGRFAKGVKKSGQQWYESQATGLGAERFMTGAAAGEGTYEEGFAPVRAVIEATKLSPRGPKGDPRNYIRVQEMGMALRKLKTGGAK